jgi:hypothetical protein
VQDNSKQRVDDYNRKVLKLPGDGRVCIFKVSPKRDAKGVQYMLQTQIRASYCIHTTRAQCHHARLSSGVSALLSE